MLVSGEAIRRFHSIYLPSAPPRLYRAPGRVNLIGEHTDYNLGLVLPMAIDLACFVVMAPSNDNVLRAHSIQLGESAGWRIDEIPSASPQGRWSDRAVGIARELLLRGVPIAGQNILIDSEVPMGSGLSSSAALGVGLALALGGPRDPRELAEIAWRVENDFVGLPCGIMDQFISASGQEGSAILLDCRSLEWRGVTLPEDLVIVTVNSMVKRELAQSAYRTRVEECARAARALGVASLRDVDLTAINFFDGGLDNTLRERARHVVTENARVEAFADAAERGDRTEMGRLVTESHRSLRDDYEVSCPELDFLVDAALEIPGVFGARMMGGGFGGSTVNLVQPDAIDKMRSRVSSKYQRFRGVTPDIHICRASAGACEVTV
jgi:galactokinase